MIDQASPLHGLNAADLEAINAGLGVIVSGYDDVAAQTVHARKSYEHSDIRIGHRYVEILRATEDGRLRIDYNQVPRHDRSMNTTSARMQDFRCEAQRTCYTCKRRRDRTDTSEDAAANFLG